MDEKELDRLNLGYVELDGCWIWIRGMFRDGYGAIVIAGKTRRAHRVAYEYAYNVTLTPDQFLHHKCRIKACIHPEHLEIVSQLTHTDSAIYGNKEKTHCPHGHEYTPANNYWDKYEKRRECLQCKLIRSNRQYRRNKQRIADRWKPIALKYGS